MNMSTSIDIDICTMSKMHLNIGQIVRVATHANRPRTKKKQISRCVLSYVHFLCSFCADSKIARKRERASERKERKEKEKLEWNKKKQIFCFVLEFCFVWSMMFCVFNRGYGIVCFLVFLKCAAAALAVVVVAFYFAQWNIVMHSDIFASFQLLRFFRFICSLKRFCSIWLIFLQYAGAHYTHWNP